jgi:hypothetical protein
MSFLRKSFRQTWGLYLFRFCIAMQCSGPNIFVYVWPGSGNPVTLITRCISGILASLPSRAKLLDNILVAYLSLECIHHFLCRVIYFVASLDSDCIHYSSCVLFYFIASVDLDCIHCFFCRLINYFVASLDCDCIHYFSFHIIYFPLCVWYILSNRRPIYSFFCCTPTSNCLVIPLYISTCCAFNDKAWTDYFVVYLRLCVE